MTKSTGVGRGFGAGRPRKKLAPVSTEIRFAAKAEVKRLGSRKVAGPLSRAVDLVDMAYDTLVEIMDGAETSAPRVSAARAIIELARAAAEKGDQTSREGKKAAAQREALRAGVGSDWGDDLRPPGTRAN